MVTRWLHLEERGGDQWVLPVWAAVHRSIAAGTTRGITPELSALGVHISSRLNVLPRVVNRVNGEVAALLEAVQRHGPEHVYTDQAEGVAFRVDDDLKYQLIADIDALLFEINSCAELMARFFDLLSAHAGRPIPANSLTQELTTALGARGVNGQWFRLLDRNRNFVAHSGTPYLAIDASGNQWDLLVMKENVRRFNDPETYFHFAELRDIVNGFVQAKAGLQAHLISFFP